MDRRAARSVIRDVRTLYTLGALGGLSDAELLERFLARAGDDSEDAFAALVHRHGPTVLGVCRRMLPASHDAEDAFQATFLVLARRAASIGRREQLANWLNGVAVRSAKECRRRAARARALERRMMNVAKVESDPTDDREDLVPLLDEELNRLPRRYRIALVACELEGRSRREAAQQLGIPEGTLSAHLARGRKLLRVRLQRRGFTLGFWPIGGLARPLAESAIPERLMVPTVRAAVAHSSAWSPAGTVSQSVSSLAERVLNTMFLTRLTLIVASLMTAASVTTVTVVLGLTALAAQAPKADPPKPGPNDLPGRVLDKSGNGVAGVQVWAMDGPRRAPKTVATATTDAQGRFVVPWPRDRRGRPGADNFGLVARGRDGSIGWLHPVWYNSADRKRAEIELHAVVDVRGRLTDNDGKPLASVEVAPVLINRSAGRNVGDFIWLSPEPAALLRTTTAEDGSFVLRGIPQGAAIWAMIAAPAFGTPTVSWDTSQAVTIALDSRLGRIKGRLEPTDARGLAPQLPLWLRRSARPDSSPPARFGLVYWRNTSADKEGTFQFDGLPPGRYVVEAYFDQDGLIATNRETEVEVGPGAVAPLEIPLQRVPMITGRVVDARTGKGIAGMRLECVRLEEGKNNWLIGETTTDSEGRYRIAARPGTIMIQSRVAPKTHLGLEYSEYPRLEVKADQTWPELKLAPATTVDGIVVNQSGQPAAGAEVFILAPDRNLVGRQEMFQTGPDGAFHYDQLDPDEKLSLWARAGDSTTNGAVVVRPQDFKGKVTLTIGPKSTVRIRGMVTDGHGNRISGAKVTLWWTRMYASDKGERKRIGPETVLAFGTTRENGWFVFRDLWPGVNYRVAIEARGNSNAEAPEVTGKAGETHDLGKIVLVNSDGHLAGRVVGSDGQPIAGAAVFNRGDGPGPIATSTDAQGRFRLEGMFPGTKYGFARKDGYRFTGVKADDDAGRMTITLLRTGEPPPAWRPGEGPSYEQQRAFAKRVLIRVWEKYHADAENNGASECIGDMGGIDPDLARQWSAENGHRHDDEARNAEARTLAETDATAALGLLNQKRDTKSQSVLQKLAERFAESDPKTGLRFAEEAAVQSRGLNQPDRTMAMARAGAILVKLGRSDVGRKLIDDAARDAAQLPAANWAGDCRSEAACTIAPYDADRALALIEPFNAANANWWQANRINIAIAIATSDTRRAIALVDSVDARGGFDREIARTAIAYEIGRDRPDEAIQIIEGMKGDPATIWQAEAMGWLAVALAPRDRARAYSLIDRALAMLIEQQDRFARSSWSGGELSRAARLAGHARRIGYPDMDSVIARVMAARPGASARGVGDRTGLTRSIALSAVPLALIDPGAARTVLEAIEARGGPDPATLWNVREPWLIAWGLVDLQKAEAIFEAELVALDQEKELSLADTGVFRMVELLTTPPERRAAFLSDRCGGAPWRPDRRP